MRRFIVLFAAIALGSYLLTMLPIVHENVSSYLNLIVSHLAGGAMMLLGKEVNVIGEYITMPGFTMRIVDLCNGLEPTLLLWSAFLAYSTTWDHKLKGMLLGFFVVLGVNLIRVCTLLELALYDRGWFDWAHWYLFDVILMVAIVLVFLRWSWRLPPPGPSDEARQA